MRKILEICLLAIVFAIGVAACDMKSPTEGHESYALQVGKEVTLQRVDGSKVQVKFLIHEDEDESEDFLFTFKIDEQGWSPMLSAKYRYQLFDGLFVHGDGVTDSLTVWHTPEWEVIGQ